MTHSFDETSESQACNENLKSMKFGDYLAVVLVGVIVGVVVSAELEDVAMCRSVRSGSFTDEKWKSRGWSWNQVPLVIHENLRQFVLLPLTCISIPWLILYKGADALSICLNTLSVLFMVEVDTLFFALLGQRARYANMRLETWIKLRNYDVMTFDATAWSHTTLLTIAPGRCSRVSSKMRRLISTEVSPISTDRGGFIQSRTTSLT